MVSPFDFIDMVAADRNLVVTSAGPHVRRLEPRDAERAWHCDLDDGTPTGEADPASFVRWVCPSSRSRGEVPRLDVRRTGPHSDLGRLVTRFARLAGRPPRDEAAARYAYSDPEQVLDDELRRRIEQWPPALHGDGVVRPAELGSIQVTSEGLVVESGSWWGSALALDHQMGLGLDIAQRLAARR